MPFTLRLQEWASRFSDQAASGPTVKQWFDQNNISIHANNYWKHQLIEEVIDQILPDIAPLPISSVENPALQIQPLSPVSDNPIRSNCANRAYSDAQIRLTVNGISIEI